MPRLTISCASILAALLPSWASWNLPYARPSKYDYSTNFSSALAAGLAAEPNLIKDEMSRAWAWYKSTFIMDNGLVNHRKKINGQITGTGEAVSEGQGYGMLLAVIMNDQATFDRMAMWATAVAASGDKAYSGKVIGRDLLLRILGDRLIGGFGSTSLGENDFYYKQSLATLGLATLMGRFPNVLEDMKGTVTPVALLSAPMTRGRPDRVAVTMGTLAILPGTRKAVPDWGDIHWVGVEGRWTIHPTQTEKPHSRE